jgi:uncharacterized damage-inducible protein DinB
MLPAMTESGSRKKRRELRRVFRRGTVGITSGILGLKLRYFKKTQTQFIEQVFNHPLADLVFPNKPFVMQQIKWFERKFEFAPQNIFPSVIERLEGTPLRLQHKLKALPPEALVWKPAGQWSIAEQTGHLADLEPLWQGRLQDILEGREQMRATDLNNSATNNANHNAQPLSALLERFSSLRQQTLESLRALREDDIFRTALHPRLQTPMRLQDLFIFVAEHDDHHLAQMSALYQDYLK